MQYLSHLWNTQCWCLGEHGSYSPWTTPWSCGTVHAVTVTNIVDVSSAENEARSSQTHSCPPYSSGTVSVVSVTLNKASWWKWDIINPNVFGMIRLEQSLVLLLWRTLRSFQFTRYWTLHHIISFVTVSKMRKTGGEECCSNPQPLDPRSHTLTVALTTQLLHLCATSCLHIQ